MKALLIAAIAATMLSGTAFAQRTSSNASLTSSNRSVSGASATASPTVNASQGLSNRTTTNVTVNNGSGDPSGDPSSGNSGGGDPQITYGGSYTVHNTPDVMPPAISGGNICAVGASGGIALSGLGIAGGATWADKPCERRQEAALLYNLGNRPAAIYLLSNGDPDVAKALHAAGYDDFGQPIPSKVAVAAPAVVAAIDPPKPLAPAPAWCKSETPKYMAILSTGQQAYVRMNCHI